MSNLVDTASTPAPVFELIETQKSLVSESVVREKLGKDEFLQRRIIHPGMKDSDVLTAFRALRTSLLPKMDSINCVLQVSTINRGGGASFCALNLAVSCTFAQHGYALLVDCNFDHPSLAETLNIKVKAGLYDYLNERTQNISDIIYPTAIPRLNVIPTGEIQSEDNIEFFTGETMRLFLEDVRNRYKDRIIIVDAPPVLESADAKILAEVSDYVLIILPYKGASGSKVDKVIKAIGKDKIIGMMINN